MKFISYTRKAAITALSLIATFSVSAAQYKFGHYFPTEDFRSTTATKFAEYAKAKSANFDITIYPAESLVKGRDALQATSRGTVDFYSVFAGYLTGSVTLMKIFTIPFPEESYSDEKMMAFANDPKVVTLLNKQLAKSNVYLLGFINSSGQTPMFFRNPLSSLADIGGRKIRGVGGYSDTALKKLGASIVFMSAAEQFIQLETGGVDGVITTESSYISLDLGQVAPYAMANTLLRTPYALLINKRKWDNLSGSDQKALTAAVQKTISWSSTHFKEESARLSKAVSGRSKAKYLFTATDWELARETRNKAMEEFAAENGENAKVLLDILSKYR